MDFVVGFYRLYVHFPNSLMMLEKRLQQLRRGFLLLVSKGKSEYEKEG